MFKGLEAFLTVDSTFLLGKGGATDIFIVGEEAIPIEGKGIGVFISIFEVKVNSYFCL